MIYYEEREFPNNRRTVFFCVQICDDCDSLYKYPREISDQDKKTELGFFFLFFFKLNTVREKHCVRISHLASQGLTFQLSLERCPACLQATYKSCYCEGADRFVFKVMET